ncbi:lipopolysaccharide exporter [Methylomarinovum tepidoasis]|uniref:Lipopolysaccharide exporter n=1 Tax=Methylomarinovum tepidoasis TaxID=2840183 RepID=A0AAU9BWJ2_9GAMM|nr:lipopolysaccharide exporter [Methylomarinovum sp. IN45]
MSRKRFLKDIVILSGGKAVSTGLRIGLVPIVSRIYLPDQYGIAALFVSLVGILVPVAVLSFPQAIVLPKEEQEAVGLALFAFLAVMVFSILLWMVIGVSTCFGMEILPQLGDWLWLLPLGVLLQGIIMGCEGWMTRRRRFVLSSLGDVLQSGTTSGMRVGGGYLLGAQLWPLMASVLAGQLLRVLIYSFHVVRIVRQAVSLRWIDLRRMVAEYRHFPLYNTPAALLRAFNTQLPLLVITWLFTAREAGQYAMVNALLVTALTVIGESVRRSYLHRTTQGGLEGKLRKDFLTVTALMFLVAAGPVALVMVYGQWLFAVVLGEKWAEAGVYAAALMPWLLMQWTAVPASALVVTLRRQRFWLLFQHGILAMQLGGMALGYYLGGDVLSLLWGCALARGIMLLGLILYMAVVAGAPKLGTIARVQEVET